MSKKAFFLLTSSMFLTACSSMGDGDWLNSDLPNGQASAQKSDVYEQVKQAEVSKNTSFSSFDSSGTKKQQITQRIISQGKLALAEHRLLTPEGDNAYLYFQIALGREPGNYEAIQGLATIVDTYIEWAERAAAQGRMQEARRFIANASQVNPDDPAISEAKMRMRQPPSNVKVNTTPLNEDVYTLPSNLFTLDERSILAYLQPIIDRVEQTRGALEINWPSDKEGRLLYQIINSRTPNFRVRAMTFRNSQHLIEIKVN